MEVKAMAKKKASKNKVAATGSAKPTALTIKGTLEWRSWVEMVADHCRTDVAKLVDAALTEFAQRKGVTTPPPKR